MLEQYLAGSISISFIFPILFSSGGFMPILEIDVIKAAANINDYNYPMYCGFESSSKLITIADVPNFSPDKPHHQIASDISNPPVDQWQRPLDDKKKNNIKEIYSRTDKNNLMANPVLIGIASPNIDSSVKVEIKQKKIETRSGEVIPIDNVFTVHVYYTSDKKPLWILDGQHRVEGLNLSTQKDEPLPFVLLYDEQLYTPPFLAEIFTQVTTKATPMEFLHGQWMKYAFRLDEYSQSVYEKSMDVAITLCKEVQLDGHTNPFHNRVQFNPYLSPTGYYAFSFNMYEWVKIIAENYYGRQGDMNPRELAAEISKSIVAFESIDSHSGNGSKLFSSSNPHKILAEGYLSGFLKYIAQNNVKKTVDEWKDFFINNDRLFDRCDWRLSFVRTHGALSSSNGKPSKIVAKESFDVSLNQPNIMSGTLLTDYLQGVESYFKVIAYQKTSAGRISNRDPYEKRISPGTGLKPFDVNNDRIVREFIRVEPESANCYVTKVIDPNINPPKELNDALKKGGLDISSLQSGYRIQVETMSYSGDTKNLTTIRLDK